MARPSGRRPAALPCASLIAGALIGQIAPALPHASLSAVWVGCVLILLIGSRRRVRCLTRPATAIAIMCFGLLLAAHDRGRTEQRVAAYFPGDRTLPVVGEMLGTVLDIAEPSFSGDRLLRLRGHFADRPELPRITAALRVASSPVEPTRRLDGLEAGQAVRVWCRLFYPRGLGNPDSPDPGVGLAGRGIDAVGTVKSARLVEPMDSSAGVLDPRRAAGELKRTARWRLERLLGGHPEARALAGAMLLGDRGMLSPATTNLLRSSGLSHLVAISGLHVGMVVSFLLVLATRSKFPLAVRPFAIAALLFGFVQLVGSRPSVTRAALAVVAVQSARGLGRTGDSINTLAWIASILVTLSPSSVLDPGFQLTVAATAGILLAIGGRREEGRSVGGVRMVLPVSGGAYLGSAPLAAWHFGWVAPVALLANLPAVPLCAILLFAGYGGILLEGMPYLGSGAGAVTAVAADGMLRIAAGFGEWEYGAFPVVRPSLVGLCFYYGAFTMREKLSGPWRRLALTLAAASALWIHNGPPPPAAPLEPEAALIDVGQGQAVLARHATGGALLIDAGGSYNPRFDVGGRVVIPFVLRQAGRRIERLVLSHDHLDHVGGAMTLIRTLELGELCLPPGFQRSARLFELSRVASERGVSIRICEAGENLGGIARVVGPSRDLEGTVNDRSVAVLVGISAPRLLIPGDLETAGERALLENGEPIAAEGLVLAHHGSRSGSTRELLSRVAPRAVLVSCGQSNRFGHPHAATLRRVRERPVVVWRTDRDGAIFLKADGGRWSARSIRR